MSNQTNAFVGGTDAQHHFLTNQVELFLFDLKNEASEHGFKPDESWALKLATEAEIAGLKRQFHPIVSLQLQSHALLKVFQQVKNKLQQSISRDDAALTASDLDRDEKKYMVAYPVRNVRK